MDQCGTPFIESKPSFVYNIRSSKYFKIDEEDYSKPQVLITKYNNLYIHMINKKKRTLFV